MLDMRPAPYRIPPTPMKTTNSSLKSFSRTALATLAIAIVSGLSVPSTQAGYTVTLQEVGANVLAIGIGVFDLTGLTAAGSSGVTLALIRPAVPGIIMGTTASSVPSDIFRGFTGPTNFGSGGTTPANLGSGDKVALSNQPGSAFMTVPAGYVSGAPLLSSDTYSGQTFASLGVTPGTYVWSWGTGANQNFTLRIGAVPESGSSILCSSCP